MEAAHHGGTFATRKNEGIDLIQGKGRFHRNRFLAESPNRITVCFHIALKSEDAHLLDGRRCSVFCERVADGCVGRCHQPLLCNNSLGSSLSISKPAIASESIWRQVSRTLSGLSQWLVASTIELAN